MKHLENQLADARKRLQEINLRQNKLVQDAARVCEEIKRIRRQQCLTADQNILACDGS